MGLRKILDKFESNIKKTKFREKLIPLYEAIDTFFYCPNNVTQTTSHVRDSVDLKRVMIIVWFCTFPTMFFGMYNIGHRSNIIFANNPEVFASQNSLYFYLSSIMSTFNQNSFLDCFIQGAICFIPIYLTTFIVGGFWEILFATIRKHEINEGFFVTSILFALILPPSIPLWQVALGISFGVVIGKEVFGGTGYNFLNPALVGRAFLFFSYPIQMSGDSVWTSVDGYSSATALSLSTVNGINTIKKHDISWMDAFIGNIDGSIGETSTLAILIGGFFLLITRIASWRIIISILFGLIVTSFLFNNIKGSSNPMFYIPWYWHLVTGGFAFGMCFMATDPVSSSITNTGKFIFGFIIGFMSVIIRVINPAFPEGIMLAIIFANIIAPLIDYFVISAHITRRGNRTSS